MLKKMLPNILSMLIVTGVTGGILLFANYAVLESNQERNSKQLVKLNSKLDFWYEEQLEMKTLLATHKHGSGSKFKYPDLRNSPKRRYSQ